MTRKAGLALGVALLCLIMAAGALVAALTKDSGKPKAKESSTSTPSPTPTRSSTPTASPSPSPTTPSPSPSPLPTSRNQTFQGIRFQTAPGAKVLTSPPDGRLLEQSCVVPESQTAGYCKTGLFLQAYRSSVARLPLDQAPLQTPWSEVGCQSRTTGTGLDPIGGGKTAEHRTYEVNCPQSASFSGNYSAQVWWLPESKVAFIDWGYGNATEVRSLLQSLDFAGFTPLHE